MATGTFALTHTLPPPDIMPKKGGKKAKSKAKGAAAAPGAAAKNVATDVQDSL